jgi:hypothetical protein
MAAVMAAAMAAVMAAAMAAMTREIADPRLDVTPLP